MDGKTKGRDSPTMPTIEGKGAVDRGPGRGTSGGVVGQGSLTVSTQRRSRVFSPLPCDP